MTNDLPPDLSAVNYCLARPSMSEEMEGRMFQSASDIPSEQDFCNLEKT
jgi:hypothetical protein